MTDPVAMLDGLVPESLSVRSARILLEDLAVQVDVGFHDFELGNPQSLLVSVEVWLDEVDPPADDDPANAWNYDVLRTDIERIAKERRYNLQETFARRLYDRVAARKGVRALRVRTSKPDVYPNARGVGAEIASFDGAWPSR